jgi:hypothetical protein
MKRAMIQTHKLIELSSKWDLNKIHIQVAEGDLGHYDFIFGRDYMKRYGVNLMFGGETCTIEWDGTSMEMHTHGFWTRDRMMEAAMTIGDAETSDVLESLLDEDKSYQQQILDSKYEKQDLLAVSVAQTHLMVEQ